MQNIETLRYKPDYIFNRIGVRKMDLDDGRKIALYYLEDLDNEDCVVGYTKLKAYKEGSKADAVLNVPFIDGNFDGGCVEFEVNDDKKRTQKLTGYAPVGENQFIGIVKSRKIPILFPLLVFLILLLGIGIWQLLPTIPNIPDAYVTDMEPWSPDIQDNLGKQNDKQKSEIGSIEVKGFSKWHVPAGQKDNLTIALENPASNRCYFTFIITLDDTDEVLYQSKMVPPGEGIYQITLSKPLEAGKYNVTVHIRTNEVETGAEMNSAEIKAVIISD